MPLPDVIIPVAERLPPVGREVLAVTARFRCLALLDAAGAWHYAARGEKLNVEVVGWMELNSSPPAPPPVPPEAE